MGPEVLSVEITYLDDNWVKSWYQLGPGLQTQHPSQIFKGIIDKLDFFTVNNFQSEGDMVMGVRGKPQMQRKYFQKISDKWFKWFV